ncbi:hypothetical protein JCM1840_001358 [Sporobolomyces johnsonii]
MAHSHSIPPFSSLTDANHPDHPYSSWSLPTSELNPLGRLSLLTPALVAQTAREEIRTGVRVSLDLPIGEEEPGLGWRKQPKREVVRVDSGPATKADAEREGKLWNPIHDDILHLNTQSYPGSGLFYGGATASSVSSGSISRGMAAWADAGGIVGRGVLIDYARWAQKNGINYEPALESHPIPLATVKEIAQAQGIEFRTGDIFILRSAEGKADSFKGNAVGIEQGEPTLRFLWESGFAAVVGDQPAFEAWPAPPEKRLHPILLSGWGLPIGELFALDALAAECERQARWTFFFSAMPLKTENGLASTGNAVAIF